MKEKAASKPIMVFSSSSNFGLSWICLPMPLIFLSTSWPQSMKIVRAPLYLTKISVAYLTIWDLVSVDKRRNALLISFWTSKTPPWHFIKYSDNSFKNYIVSSPLLVYVDFLPYFIKSGSEDIIVKTFLTSEFYLSFFARSKSFFFSFNLFWSEVCLRSWAIWSAFSFCNAFSMSSCLFFFKSSYET